MLAFVCVRLSKILLVTQQPNEWEYKINYLHIKRIKHNITMLSFVKIRIEWVIKYKRSVVVFWSLM